MSAIIDNRVRHQQPEPRRLYRIHLPAKGVWRPPETGDDRFSGQDDEQTIRCRTCNTVITHRNQALRVNNRHQHAFFNPAGIAFEVRCFRHAQGVVASGEPSAEFTWFPGYRWQVLFCCGCQSHLGWLFRNGTPFFGLIAARLA